jgi:hypothetical protein
MSALDGIESEWRALYDVQRATRYQCHDFENIGVFYSLRISKIGENCVKLTKIVIIILDIDVNDFFYLPKFPTCIVKSTYKTYR